MLNTSDKQDWLSETRNLLSDAMTQAFLLDMELRESQIDVKRRKELFEKFTIAKNKLVLLLSPAKEKHDKLLKSMEKLALTLNVNVLYNNPSLRKDAIPYDNTVFWSESNEVMEVGRNLFYDAWQKNQ